MKIFKKLAAFICTAVVACSCLATSAFAESLSDITSISTREDVKALANYYRGADTVDARGNAVFTNNNQTQLNGSEKIYMDKTYGVFVCQPQSSGGASTGIDSFKICYDADKLNTMTKDELSKATQEMVATFAQWGMSSDATSKFSNAIKANNALPYTNADAVAALFNQGADIDGAMSWFAPFQGVVGLILGILVVILILLLLASTVLDLVYIGLPTARMAMTAKAEGQGKEVPFGISQDALRIVNEEAETGKGNGGNVYLKYAKSRILTYIILAVCILYLVSGQIGNLISGLLNVVSGIG